MQTAIADIHNVRYDNSTTTRILFDSGSQRTYILQRVREQLNLETIRKEKVIIKGFGNTSTKVQTLDVVQVKVRHKVDGNFTYLEALCVPFICGTLHGQHISEALKYEHVMPLELADEGDQSGNIDIGVLVGVDFYHNFFSGKVVKAETGPVACETSLGWVLSGKLNSPGYSNSLYCLETHLLRCQVETSVNHADNLRTDLNKFWNIEDVGSSDCVISSFKKDVYHDGTRYITKLPFKVDHDKIPDNFSVCKKRLEGLKKRLDSKNIVAEYDNIFKEYENNGIIERVPFKEISMENGSVHYLPHRPVIRNDKETTKIRAVFDASCKVNGPSLNEILYPGPNLLLKIFDALTRFRFNPIGLLADIKQAFLNVGISDEHKNYLRFLWYDINNENSPCIVYRFLRVVFGVTSSPFLLNATIKHHLNKYSCIETIKAVVEVLLNDLYVDDLVSGVSSISEGKHFFNVAKRIMSEGVFELRKWVTNSPELSAHMKAQDKPSHSGSTGDDLTYFESMSHTERTNKTVLGVTWDTKSDEFVFNFDSLLDKCHRMSNTKRELLSVSASVFDPLGILAPITARIKTIFQLLCRDQLDWDSRIPDRVMVIWKSFLFELESLKEVRVPRFVLVEAVEHVELHGFSDSSKEVYCAVVYLRVLYKNSVKVSLLSSKTKVAPMKELTIPRLELSGCVLLTKLLKDILSALEDRLKISNVFGWSDSKVSLHWIKGKEKSWKPWVENRVVNIRKVVDRDRWCFVPGEINPADIPTRLAKDLIDCFSSLWYFGPSFLSSSTFTVDEFLFFDENNSTSASDSETSLSERRVSETSILTVTNVNDGTDLNDIIDYNDYSSLRKLIMVTGYVFRFIANIKKKLSNEESDMNESLSLEEYEDAQVYWIKQEQYRLKQQPNYAKLQASLKLYIDDRGLIRMRGRFGNSSVLDEQKYPIILRDSTSHLTILIIWNAHESVLHHGIESTLSFVRRKYWICKGRKSIKNVIGKCITCRRHQGKTMKPPETPDLPNYRTNYIAHAFQSTGLDFAGPLYVSDKKDSKTYILLLTCASSRAIHLELVSEMTVGGFLRGFKRFISRRGVPKLIIHDNFKTFKSLDVKRFMLYHGIEQTFILPLSPWWGGFYERLVRTVKSSLKKILGKSFATFEELQTILCAVEAVIISRPLVYLSSDDIDEAITPYHLIHGRTLVNHTRIVEPMIDFTVDDCRKRILHVRKLMHDFWSRFSDNYINELRQFHSYSKAKASSQGEDLVVGDVVLIKEDNIHKNDWKLGKITQLVRGKDNRVRGVELKTISRTGQATTCVRPLQKIIPFEILDKSSSKKTTPIELDDTNDSCGQSQRITDSSSNRKSIRKAAIEGNELRKLREKHS